MATEHRIFQYIYISLQTVTGEGVIATEYYVSEEDDNASRRQGSFIPKEADAKKKARKVTEKAKRELDRAEAEGEHLWDVAKEQLLRPGVAGGLIGLSESILRLVPDNIEQISFAVNVGLIGSASYALYTDPFLRRDTRFLSTLAVSSLAILGIEGFAADKYAQTESGRVEAQRAKAEGAAVWRHTREVVLRPGVLSGIVGVVNVGILGTVGWFGYANWDAPRWDRKVVSAVGCGLLTLWGVEG